MITTQLNHVAIHVEDVDRSVAFYRDVLKLTPLARPAFTFPGAWFRLGLDQELHIIGERKGPVTSASRGNHFALMADDLDAWESHLSGLGVLKRPRQLRPDGAHQIFFQDPDGHTIELCTSPPEKAQERLES